MERLIRSMSSVLGVIATVATVIMMVGIAIDVFYRALYDKSLPGVLELSETALVAAVFLGIAYTGSTNSHIQVDLLTERLPERARQIVVAIAWLLTTAFLAWATYATVLRAMKSTNENEIRMGLVNWPMFPARWLIAIGFAAMLLVALVNVARTLKGEEVIGFSSPERVPDSPVHPFELTEQFDIEQAELEAVDAASAGTAAGTDETTTHEGADR